MTRLPIVSGKDVIKVLLKSGYYIRRQKGSHVRLYHDAKPPITVPLYKDLKKGTLRSIIRDAELDVEEFIGLLKG